MSKKLDDWEELQASLAQKSPDEPKYTSGTPGSSWEIAQARLGALSKKSTNP